MGAGPVTGGPVGEQFAGWLSLNEACARTGWSASTVRRYAAIGKIRQANVSGLVCYDPESLTGGVPEQEAIVDVVKVQTAALRESHEQSRILLDKLIGMTSFMDRVFTSLEREATELRAQRASLEAELRAGRELVEKIQVDEEERRMARAAFEAEQQRWRTITKKFSDLIDPVVSSLMFKAAPGSRAVQDSILARMLERLDDSELDVVLSHPKFDPTERAAVLEMRRALRKQRAEREAAAEQAAQGAGTEPG